MTATLKRKTKKAEKIVIDFTPVATQSYRDHQRHVFLHLRDEDGEGVFLTMRTGQIALERLPIVIPDGAKHSVYRLMWNREDVEDLEPLALPYDFKAAVSKFHAKGVGRTAGAEAEMRRILGMQPLEGATDESLAVTRPERTRSRKAASEGSVAPKERQPGGYSLQSLCEDLGIEPVEARKFLRQSKAEKPGGRWEWPSAEAAASIRALLETMPKE